MPLPSLDDVPAARGGLVVTRIAHLQDVGRCSRHHCTTPDIPTSQLEDLRETVCSEYADISCRTRNSHQRRCASSRPASLFWTITEENFAPCVLGCSLRDVLSCVTTSLMFQVVTRLLHTLLLLLLC